MVEEVAVRSPQHPDGIILVTHLREIPFEATSNDQVAYLP
jgi:hypothetical protein